MLKLRAIGIADVREALQSIQSVSTEGMIESFENWDLDFFLTLAAYDSRCNFSCFSVFLLFRNAAGWPQLQASLTDQIANLVEWRHPAIAPKLAVP